MTAMTCITSGCAKPVHASGNRFCADCLIAFQKREIERLQFRVRAGDGLPLRDYFAGQAIRGTVFDGYHMTNLSPEGIARYAYEVADAMLAVREDTP